MSESTTRTSVLVVGGGPAGATAAALLARQGIDVAVFEREHFPRYHIGESILPACHPVLDLMGAREKIMQHGFRRKSGQYLRWGNEKWDYRFGALSGAQVYTWQVERSEFDEILLRHAAEQGAQVFEGRRVTEVHFDGDRPTAVTWTDTEDGSSGRHEFDFLVDASGRAGLLVNRYIGGRTYNESFRNVAVWAYWDDAKELPHAPDGATVVSSVRDGWVWAIPLRTGMSIGVILHKRRFTELRDAGTSLEKIYHEMLAEADEISDITDGATCRGNVRADQDYSYSAERYSGPGYFITGDSAAFLDPLLSSGVHLAMFSSLLAAASIAAIRRGQVDEESAASFFHDSYHRTYLRFLVIVAAVYNQYDGKESYFWQAKDLVRDGYQLPQDVMAPFLQVVTGTADFEETTRGTVARQVLDRAGELFRETHKVLQDKLKLANLSDAEREVIQSRGRYWNSLVRSSSLAEDDAVGGLYIVTEPE
ncbi:MAG: tryptophan 7-halogenase, partial [Actinocatenispora sp.]